MRMATVTRKRIPMSNAVVLSFFRSMIRVAFPSYAEASCTVMSSIMPVTASQRLTFQKSNGNCVVSVL